MGKIELRFTLFVKRLVNAKPQLPLIESVPIGKGQLRPRELEAVYKVRDALVADLCNPPPFAQLASSVGMNQNKLSRKFKEVFGVTVFNYLREQRLQHSRHLLERKMTVKQVASVVGYKNSGDFATAFRERFQVTPTDYQQQFLKTTGHILS